jgi:calcineurin-like phosphoesterase family protein
MSNIWFISDTHFGHTNIRHFCPSRAKLGATIEEHDEELIRRWNGTVGKKDQVYHLGDVAFGPRKADLSWVNRLKGRKFLLRGNHDTGSYRKWAEVFEELLPSAYPLPRMREIVLSHVPLHPLSLKRWLLNVHGHLHENLVTKADKRTPRPNYMNVSVEQTGFRPLHLEVVEKRLRQIDAAGFPPAGWV